MNIKTNRKDEAPIDLLALSRSQLAIFLCSLDHAAQHEVLRELAALEEKGV